jgi:hypothetical protein
MELFQEIVNRNRLQGIGKFPLAIYIDHDDAERDECNQQ